jgi:DNA-directed RNA polymerase subunit K/omega
MSEYSDDEDFDYGDIDYEPEDEVYFNEEIQINGHDKDDEDVREEKAEAELYEQPEEQPEKEEEPEDEEIENDEDFEEEKDSKDKGKIVPKSQRKSHPLMTKYEYAYLISQRAMAIENDSPLMFPETTFIHSIDIAREETEKGVNPIIIQRVMPNGDIEEWSCSELRLPRNYD